MKSAAALTTLIAMASAFCDHGTTFRPRNAKRAAVGVADFGFNELEGPLYWHGLDSNNTLCATGKSQSPINIDSTYTKAVKGKSLIFEVKTYPEGAHFANLGSTVEVEAEGKLVIGKKTSNLVQFHFHTPSEHRINSEHYPMEVHFVFQAADESLSVVGFPIEIGTDKQASSLLANVFESVDSIATPGSDTKTGPIDFSELTAHLKKSNVFQYSGSLTTPPCREKIAWNVVKEPIYVDIATYRAAKSVMKFNSRFTQNHPGEVNLIKAAASAL